MIDTLARLVPFTREVFLNLFERYNDAIWPAQVAAYLLCLVAVGAALRPFAGSGRLIAAILAVLWIWTGIAYHMMFLARINWAASAFGLLFVVQGLLFVVTGVLRGRTAFRMSRDAAGWCGLALFAIAAVLYPLAGAVADQPWPRIGLLGVAPCPTAVFTLGMLLLAVPRVPWHLMALPVLWSLIGGSAALVLALPQDIVLPAAALLAVILGLRKNRLSRSAA